MDFVYQVLFPFVRVHLKDYLRHNADSKELQRDLSMLREEHVKDMEQGLAPRNGQTPTRMRKSNPLPVMVSG